MIGRLLFFVLGTLLGVFVVLRLRDLLRRSTPDAVADKVGQARDGLGERVGEFAATFRTAMHEREAELRDALGMDEGTDAAAEAGHIGEADLAGTGARRAAGR